MQANRVPSSFGGGSLRRPRATTTRRPAPPPPSSSSAPAASAPPSSSQSQSPNARLAQRADELGPEKYDRLLRWACGCDNAYDAAGVRAPPRVAVVEDDAGGGRGLVASEDVEEGTVLMSVPLSRVFCSAPGDQCDDDDDGDEAGFETPWALGMGARLLALVRSRGGAAAAPEQQQLDGWGLWAAALPQRIVTPLDFSERAIDACGEGGTGRGVGAAIVGMQGALKQGSARAWRRWQQQRPSGDAADDGQAPPALSPQDSDADVLWAVKALSSRCFFEPSLQAHLCVPGVDMANHHDGGGEGGAGGPSARVELARSPQAVQGVHVLDEFFDASGGSSSSNSSNESEFRLVADRDLKRGEAVTISYGRWPAEVFFLLFGFVPGATGAAGGARRAPLPGDALLLYESAEELGDHLGRLEASDALAADAWRAAAARLEPEEAAAISRLAATAEGLDARLAGAIAALAKAASAEVDGGAAPPSPEALVRARVAELLEGYEAAVDADVGDDHEDAEELSLARAYAATKAATARAVLAALDPSFARR